MSMRSARTSGTPASSFVTVEALDQRPLLSSLLGLSFPALPALATAPHFGTVSGTPSHSAPEGTSAGLPAVELLTAAVVPIADLGVTAILPHDTAATGVGALSAVVAPIVSTVAAVTGPVVAPLVPTVSAVAGPIETVVTPILSDVGATVRVLETDVPILSAVVPSVDVVARAVPPLTQPVEETLQPVAPVLSPVTGIATQAISTIAQGTGLTLPAGPGSLTGGLAPGSASGTGGAGGGADAAPAPASPSPSGVPTPAAVVSPLAPLGGTNLVPATGGLGTGAKTFLRQFSQGTGDFAATSLSPSLPGGVAGTFVTADPTHADGGLLEHPVGQMASPPGAASDGAELSGQGTTEGVSGGRLDLVPVSAAGSGPRASQAPAADRLDELVAFLASDLDALESSAGEFLDSLRELGDRIVRGLPDPYLAAFVLAALFLGAACRIARQECRNPETDPEAATETFLGLNPAGG